MEHGTVEREIRRLRKSLKQIESLERLDRELTSDEAQKVLKKTAIRSALVERLNYLEENGVHHTSITESNTSRLTDSSCTDILQDDLAARTEEPALPFSSPLPRPGHEDPDGIDGIGVSEPTATWGSVTKVTSNCPSEETPPERERKGLVEVTSLNGSGKPSSPIEVSTSGPSKPATPGPKQPAAAIGLNKSHSPDMPTSQGSSLGQSKATSQGSTPGQSKAVKTKRSKWLNQRVVVSCLEGHCDVVSSMDSNGEVLMTGSRDTTVRVWCLKKMAELCSMGGHKAAVTCVKLLPKGEPYHPDTTKGEKSAEGVESAEVGAHQLGLSGSLDCHIILWDITAGKKLTHIYTFSSVMSLEYSNGKVITGSDGGKVEVWSLESRQLLQTIRGPAKGVTCLVLRDDHLYCGDVAGMVHIWRLHPPAMKEEEGTGWAVSNVNVSDEVPFRARCIRCLCVHGSVVYWGDDGTNIKVLDISNGSLCTLANHTHSFGSTGGLAVCEDEHILISSSYNLDTGQASINVRSLVAGEKHQYLCSLQPTNPTVPYISTLIATRHFGNGCVRLCTGGNELRVWDFVSESASRFSSGQSVITPTCVLPDEASGAVDTESDTDTDDDGGTGEEVDPLRTLHLKPLPQAKAPVPLVARPESWFWWLCRCTVL